MMKFQQTPELLEVAQRLKPLDKHPA